MVAVIKSNSEARESLLRFWGLREPWETLRQRIADDQSLMALVARAAPGNLANDQTSRLLFAAMAFLGARHGFELPRDSAWASFVRLRKLLLKHAADLTELLQRPVQVNDPLRCVALYPGLLFAAARVRKPLALVEVGPSLGLNLCMDQFAYDYGEAGMMGMADSPCRLTAEVNDLAGRSRAARRRMFPARVPVRIGARIGLELSPVPRSRDSVAWMRAFHFPDGEARFDAAVRVLRRVAPRIVRGDASATLSAALARIPATQVPLVFHSSVVYQMSAATRERFMARLAQVAASRRMFYMTWAEEPARRGAPLQVTDFDLAHGRAERHLLAFVNQWEPVPRIDWVHRASAASK